MATSENKFAVSSKIETNPRTALCVAVMFLTRFPVGSSIAPTTQLSATVWTFPLVGALVGLFGGMMFVVCNWIGLPVWLSAGAAIGATYLATGGLHEDGLADVADGFGGGTDRERKLAIMRDSRIGSYGVAAMVFSMLMRIGAVASFVEPEFVVAAMIAAGAASRGAIGLVMASLPTAREDGLSASAGRPSQGQAWIGVTFAFVIGAFIVGFLEILLAMCAAGLAVVIFALLAKRQIGGQSGDVLGAVSQIAEIGVLTSFSVG